MIITAYEIYAEKREQHLWAPWVRILKQISQLLLVAYSGLNPIAYCGELISQLCYQKIVKKYCFDALPACLKCCHNRESASQQSELDIMKSVGITLNGADPIHQQLQELDIQSRIMAGLPASPTALLATSNLKPRGNIL